MNGAELPCGTAIKVEPSDPMYQLRKKKQMNYYGGASQQGKETEATEEADVDGQKLNARTSVDSGDPRKDREPKANEDDEDLDNFFGSLEKDGPANKEESDKGEEKKTKDDEADLDSFFESLT